MGLRTASAIAICALVLGGPATGQPGQRGVSNREVAAAVPAEFRPLYEGGIQRDKVPDVWAGLPYDRIDLERTVCFGTCPIYRVSLFRGGRAEWSGVRYTERMGDFEGKTNVFDYGKLCYLLKKVGFDQLPQLFTADWTDSPTFIVTVAGAGKTKTVSDYSGVGPIELWAVQQTIDALGQRIQWTRK
jgi:hypothetical protein